LRPLILFVVMMRTMDAWRIFDKIFVITGGGPGTATETLTLYNYRVTFNLLRIGLGSAIGVWTLIFLLGIIGVYLYFLYRRE
jgi:multiple sugar transport system permease protein